MTRRPTLRLAVLIALLTPPMLVTAGSAGAVDVEESAIRSSPTAVSLPADCTPTARFKVGTFPHRPRVTNKWLPLVPGTNFVMEGTVVEEGVTHQHRIVTTVTDLTKTINRVRSVVVFDRDFDNGELQESELAFMAQDANKRVWNVGEYPEVYADGKLEGAPSTWIAGVEQARAGIGMQPVPRVGSAAYLQGVAPKVDFRDCARVVQTDQRVCVPVRCYDNVLVTDEWAPLESEGGHQLKYYAPGVGNIKVGAVGGDSPEVLRLTHRTKLSDKHLAAVRKEVLRQDRRGYRVSPKVYGRTPPAREGRCS